MNWISTLDEYPDGTKPIVVLDENDNICFDMEVNPLDHYTDPETGAALYKPRKIWWLYLPDSPIGNK